jgi:hypothetical protein
MVAGLLIVGPASGADDDIVFAQKLFTDLPDYGAVEISGTLTGDGIANKNNTISISCYKERRECQTFVRRCQNYGLQSSRSARGVNFCDLWLGR